MNPFTGLWIANIDKSRRDASHQFHSATLTFEIAGDEVSLIHGGVNMSGTPESGRIVLHADGLEHPASPQAPGVVAVTRWLGAQALATEARRDGHVFAKATYAVSDDGQTLTATVVGIDASGTAFDQAIVFDRASSAPGVASRR
jgi:hypothetical protein